MAAVVDDVFVGFEDAVREPVFTHELPDVFDGIEFGRFRRQGQDGDIFEDQQVVGHVPSCLVHDEDGVRIVGDVSGDLDQMLVHGMGIAPRHDESCGLAVLRADRAEDIGGACALVVRCRWP